MVKSVQRKGIISEGNRTRWPYDNSCIGCFFATLKNDRIYSREYFRADMFRYVEFFIVESVVICI